MNETGHRPHPASPSESGFDAIEVALHFEIARWNAPLTALGELAAGAVIETGRRLDEPLVTIWAEERCIGQGELVAVGDRLGVRLTSIFGKAWSAPAVEGALPSPPGQPAVAAASDGNA